MWLLGLVILYAVFPPLFLRNRSASRSSGMNFATNEYRSNGICAWNQEQLPKSDLLPFCPDSTILYRQAGSPRATHWSVSQSMTVWSCYPVSFHGAPPQSASCKTARLHTSTRPPSLPVRFCQDLTGSFTPYHGRWQSRRFSCTSCTSW